MKTRREFLTQAACGSCLLMAGSSLLFLESCATTKSTPSAGHNELSLPLTSFNEKPSVVVSYPKKGNIMIRKKEDGTYEAFSLVCTHRGGKVVESGNELKCTFHGSGFDLDGRVIRGPAKLDLQRFDVLLEEDKVVVKVV